MKIVFATSNVGKIAEIQTAFQPLNIEIIPQSQFDLKEVEETASTFVENALLKARCAAEKSHLPALADDSGLMVDALNDAPGIYSARYAGENADPKANIQKLLNALKEIPQEKRTARFYCVLVYLRYPTDPCAIICEGIWKGSILFEPKGDKGFGYDPVFYVPSHHCSAAELPLEEKNQISHRGQALRKIAKLLNKFCN